MITTIFSKSNPFNYILISVLLILSFFIYQFNQNFVLTLKSGFTIAGIILLLIGTLLVSNFLSIKNVLVKNNTYPILFYFLFLICCPMIFQNMNLVVSNTFIVLALRRLLSVQSLKKVKQKLFDASMLIFLASLFQFWTILFILAVFATVIFHVSRDYRNWILPYIALFASIILFLFSSFLFDETLITYFFDSIDINTSLNYFPNTFQNVGFAFFCTISALFVGFMAINYSKKPLISHASYKILIFAYIIGIFVFVLSPNKNNGQLVFCFLPLAIFAANYFENQDVFWTKETTSIIFTIVAIVCFLGQL
jgi:MFS family permease